jgi:5-methyltetrahydrofolate--homocysteine methyltransferase
MHDVTRIGNGEARLLMTRVASASKELTIFPDGPTVLIGERISPAARKGLGEALRRGDYSMACKEALDQVAAGADIIDVVVSHPGVDEIKAVTEVIREISKVTDTPLCVDSPDPQVLRAAAQVYPGKLLASSVTGEDSRLDQVLPLVREYGCAVIGLTMDDRGIPGDPQARVDIARRIFARAESLGIPPEDVIIDCACMTVGSDTTAALATLEAARLIREEFGCNLTLGASNVSYGLPDRRMVNLAFLPLAIQAGINCPIVDPLSAGLREIVLATDLLLNRDKWAARYTRNYKAQRASAAS